MHEHEFAAVVSAHRAELEVHCYRMLGSVSDAEDAVQDTLLRAWSAMDRLVEGSNVRAWLYRIATNRCLTLIERRRRRELPVDLAPGSLTTEVAWLEPYPTGRVRTELGPEAEVVATETTRLAFIALLQHLPGPQRAALVLRDALGFPAAEAAQIMDVSVAALNSALQRARAAARESLPPPDDPDDEVARVAELYVRAWEQGDVDGILALLSSGARYSMPPSPTWYAGRQAIRDFLLDEPLHWRWRFVTTRANEQVAFGTYAWDDQRGAYVAVALDLVEVRGGSISEVVSFLSPEMFARFDLPEELDAAQR